MGFGVFSPLPSTTRVDAEGNTGDDSTLDPKHGNSARLRLTCLGAFKIARSQRSPCDYSDPAAAMKTEHLLNSDHNVDAERPVEQGRTEPRLRISTQGKIDLEHDAVYFGAGSSSKSFSGYVSRCLEDQEVSEYIRRSNPALYERLWGIPQYQQHNLAIQATTERAGLGDGAGDGRPPMDATIQLNNEMAGAASSSDQSCARRPTSIVSPKSPDSITSIDSCGGHLLSIPSSKKPALQSAVSPLRSKSELQQDLYLLQQKRYIQSLLLS